MSDELKRLRIELDVLERYAGDHVDIREAEKAVRLKIAKIEAEADPWKQARQDVEYLVKALDWKHIGDYVSHLTAENARLAARVAELETVASDVTAILEVTEDASVPGTDAYTACVVANEIISDGGKQLREWAKCPDPDDPVLDPARVMATAAEALKLRWRPDAIGWLKNESGDAKPYRLKGAENGS